MSTVSRLFPKIDPAQMFNWINTVVPLRKTEVRLSYDEDTNEFVAELVSWDSTCESARSTLSPESALETLINQHQLGGING